MCGNSLHKYNTTDDVFNNWFKGLFEHLLFVAHLASGQLLRANAALSSVLGGPRCLLVGMLPTLTRANCSAQTRRFRQFLGPKLHTVSFVAHIVSGQLSAQTRRFRQFLGPVWGPSCLLSVCCPHCIGPTCAQTRRVHSCLGPKLR